MLPQSPLAGAIKVTGEVSGSQASKAVKLYELEVWPVWLPAEKEANQS